MKPLFDTCRPRPEVLRGELRDEMFAARLHDVVTGLADPVYGDPDTFFRNTYATDGLRTLLAEVLGRLSGASPTSSPFLRLETSFGGGKTHNLIALYHLARGKVPAGALPPGLVDPALLPGDGSSWSVAGVVGSDLDPANGVDHGAVKVQTLWGEIAWQLGGANAYRHVEKSDRERVAPGTQVLEKIVGERPALIMIDEIARHLRAAKAVPTASGKSDLAEQTVAFLFSLLEFAASRATVVVVMTLADAQDAFGAESEALKDEELRELRRVSARQERVLSPTDDREIARIVTHRLFESVDRNAAREAADAYVDHWTRLASQAELPTRATRAEYRAEIEADYPFHPELLTTLSRKTATIPNFQRTRGALRLLARVVRLAWTQREADTWLLAPHHLDLADRDLRSDLTSRLERHAFEAVIEADIVSSRKGSLAHCTKIDQRWIEAGKPAYARRAATTVFLHSLTQGTAAGIEKPDLLLSVVQPGDDPHPVGQALDRMTGSEGGSDGTACWYLHADSHRFVFKTEASIEKVIQDEAGSVNVTRAKTELKDRIKKIWRSGALKPIFFPAEPLDLPDDAREPKLAIMSFDQVRVPVDCRAPPADVEKLFTHAGSSHAYRTYKNNVVFLCADEASIDRLVDKARRFRAIQTICDDPGRSSDFSEEQRRNLRRLREEAELDLRLAITLAYRILFYPSPDARSTSNLAAEPLPAAERGEVERDQCEAVLRTLAGLGKVLGPSDPPLSAQFVRSKAWPTGAGSVTTSALQQEFAKRLALKILLDPGQLLKTIRQGVEQGRWIYFDTVKQLGWDKRSLDETPPPNFRLAEDAELFTPEEALAKELPLARPKGPPVCERCGRSPCGCDAACPLCGRDPCACGETCARCGKDPCSCSASGPVRVSVQAPLTEALRLVQTQFSDAKRTHLDDLRMHFELVGESGVDTLRKLHLALPQLGVPGLRLDLDLEASFGEGGQADRIQSKTVSGWDRYRRIGPPLVEAIKGTANTRIRITVTLPYPSGLEVAGQGFQNLLAIFEPFALGSVRLEAQEHLPGSSPGRDRKP